MGNIKKILASKEVADHGLYVGSTWEDCENIHLHWDNFRLIMTEKDFLSFVLSTDRALVRKDDLKLKGEAEKGHCLVQWRPEYRYFKNRLQIELQDAPQTNMVHIHLRDLRLEVSIEEFKEMTECMVKAVKELPSNS